MDKEEQTVEVPGDKGGEKVCVDLDSVLVEEVGFGWFQVRTLMLLAVVVIFNAFSGTEYIFTATRISSRCLIPECENAEDSQFSPPWILNAVPASGSGFDNCQRFANSSLTALDDEECPASLFNQDSVMPCERYVYENTNTVVYSFDLACDEWRRSLIGTARTVGQLFALPIVGFVSDRWGRRVALALAAFNAAWIGLLRYWADTYLGFILSQAFEAIFGSGHFSCCYVLVMELAGPRLRVAGGITISTFYAIGQVILGLIAWAIPNWKTLTLAIYAPQLILFSYFWIMTESIRWYMSRNRFEDSEKLLRSAAKLNGREVSEKSLSALRDKATLENNRKGSDGEDEPWLIVLVWRHKPVLIRCIMSPLWWITMTFIYHGLTINSVNISGNLYVNFIAVTAVEIPGFWISVPLMNWFGRKPVLTAGYFICAACQVGYIFMPEDQYAISLAVYLIGKCSIATVVTTLYVYTAELYPTRHRNSLFGFSSMLGRVGSIVAPLTPAFGDDLPFILFASFAVMSGLLVFLAPETLGTKFPDTMEEAANIGKRKR